MRPRQRSGHDVVEELLAPVEPSWAGDLVVLGEPPAHPIEALAVARTRLATLPCVLVAGPDWPAGHPWLDLADARAGDDAEACAMAERGATVPVAAAALAVHLRAAPRRTVGEGLAAESALYSALQAGDEHAAWRARTPVHPPRADDDGPRVRVERAGDRLAITLARPAVRNALDARLRDELASALAIAVADPDLHVELAGEGPAFCAGGDLDEFGTRPDVAAAHLVRLERSLPALVAAVAPQCTMHLHGACAGSGVELAAFAGRVVAEPGTTLLLPELAMGLVPGAGGTESLPRRIGRQATMRLCLLGTPIGAEEARTLGLVDEIALI